MGNLLKNNSRDYNSLLLTFNMPKTLFQYFSGVLWTCVCLLSCFYFYDFFLMSLLLILNRSPPWSTFSVFSFKHILSYLLGWVRLKKITKGLHSSNFKKRKHWYSANEILIFCYWDIIGNETWKPTYSRS